SGDAAMRRMRAMRISNASAPCRSGIGFPTGFIAGLPWAGRSVPRYPPECWRSVMAKRTLDTGTIDLLASVEDGIATIVMNRPERRNALSGSMLKAMGAVLAECESDPAVACVVLTGAGGAFCAGGDVKGMADGSGGGSTAAAGADIDSRIHDMADGSGGGSTAAAGADIDSRIHAQRLSQRATAGKLYKLPKPTIAAIPGAAAGAGLSLALACDLRIAAEGAVMTTAFAKVGFSGDYGGTYFLCHLVGSGKARELYYLSDRIDMAEALRLGLVNWVVPSERLDAKTHEIARRLAKGPRITYRYMKENINRALSGADVDDCLDLEATHHNHTGMTEDHREAAKAFVEKREPSLSAELLAHTTPIAMIERLVISFIASLAAGYIAALLSGESRGAPLIAGVLLLVIFVPYHLYDRDAQGTIWTSFPLWNHLTFFVSLPLLSVIGRRLWH